LEAELSRAARTTVMAAANPVSGHYNRAKTVNENLKMSAAILSRFDLLYILIDRQDDVQDRDNTRQVCPSQLSQRPHAATQKLRIEHVSV
jgi:DNA replicative helicase MCM subunit Mcm2 (Cdc46/Mcm family)